MKHSTDMISYLDEQTVIEFSPLDGIAPEKTISTIEELPDQFKERAIEGAHIIFRQYDFGVVFSQRVLIGNYTFWLHIFEMNQKVRLQVAVNRKVVTLHYMISGKIRCSVQGEHTKLQEGKYQLFGLAPEVISTIYLGPFSYSCFNVTIPLHMISKMGEAYEEISRFSALLTQDRGNIHYSRPIKISAAVRKHIDQILLQKKALDCRQKSMRYFSWKEHILGLFNQYLIDKNKLQPHEECLNNHSIKSEEICKYVTDYIMEENTEDPCSLHIKNVLNAFQMKETTFRNVLQKEHGCTWRKFLHRCRIEKSRELLLNESHISIADIAFMVGYSVPCHFSRAFKKHYGSTPADFRKTNAMSQKLNSW